MKSMHDYHCNYCNNTFEDYVEWDQYKVVCPTCGETAVRVYVNFKGIKNTSPTWMKDTLKVVDKEGGPHCQEFLKHQNRDTYNNWMKGEGLRPIEQGEKLAKPVIDTSGIRKKVKEKFVKDNSITVRG